MFKFYDEYYVGFQLGVNSRLAFATPYENNAAGKKRIETVDNWRSKNADAKIYKNEPRYGFKLTDVVSRYSTSNKLFRVLDPHGYELEISADNVLDIALSSGINRGIIADKMVWARLDGKNWLLNSDHPDYAQKEVIAKIKKENPLPGQALVNAVGNHLMVFMGVAYLNAVDLESEGTSFRPYSYYHKSLDSITLKINRQAKPALLYKSFYLRGEDWTSLLNADAYRVHPNLPDYVLYSGEVPEAKIKFDKQWVNLGGSLVKNYHNKFMLFETKHESLDFQHSGLNSIINEMIGPTTYIKQSPNLKKEVVYTVSK